MAIARYVEPPPSTTFPFTYLTNFSGWANTRLVDADVALQHNLGLGGAVVINVYKRADGGKNSKISDQEVIKRSSWDYNPATEARFITKEDAEEVRSKKYRVEYALADTQEKIQARL